MYIGEGFAYILVAMGVVAFIIPFVVAWITFNVKLVQTEGRALAVGYSVAGIVTIILMITQRHWAQYL